jgi:pyruvate/2-oxoglutarate dehydrogenase complex dihydrolipoamide acyltransferase (E2) component
MRTEVRLPNLGAEATAAVVSAWLVQAGDRVTAGQVLAEIETEKATVDLEAPCSGTVTELTASAGDEVEVGGLLALIEQD